MKQPRRSVAPTRSANAVPTKIVIVDAEPVVRSPVAAIMQSDGYEVIQTDDPKAVLEIIKAGT